MFLLIVCNGHFDFVKYNYLKTILTIIKAFMVTMWNIWDVTDNAERNELYKSTRDQNVQWLIFLKSIWRDAISLGVVLLCVFMSRVPYCDVYYDFRMTRYFVRTKFKCFILSCVLYLKQKTFFFYYTISHQKPLDQCQLHLCRNDVCEFLFLKKQLLFHLDPSKNMTAIYNYWFWVADPLYIFSCEIVKLIR